MKHVILTLLLITSASTMAVASTSLEITSEGPYTYEMWKKHVYVAAQNKFSQITNTILAMKSNKFEDAAQSLGSEDQRSALAQERKDAIIELEAEKALAEAEMEDAKSFTYDQYLTVYVSSLDPESLRDWSENIKPEAIKKLAELYLSSKLELPRADLSSNPERFKEVSSASDSVMTENIIKN